MPFGDGTGPDGQGPMMGRGGRGWGRGGGQGRGRGRGRCGAFDDAATLTDRIDWMETALTALKALLAKKSAQS